MPFNVGPAELMIVMAIALIVFGPKKLPEIGKGIGNAMREFNKARNDFMETINSESDRHDSTPSYSTAAALAEGPPVTPSSLEYPQPLAPESADALPYGGDFQAEGDSQPAFRTAEPPVPSVAHSADGSAVLTADDSKTHSGAPAPVA
jgi:sec-independent protein translocase protein TatA